MKYVLFACTHNAGRSLMAQAFWQKYAPADVRADSAGQAPRMRRGRRWSRRCVRSASTSRRNGRSDLTWRCSCAPIGRSRWVRRRVPLCPRSRRGLGDPRSAGREPRGGAADPRRPRTPGTRLHRRSSGRGARGSHGARDAAGADAARPDREFGDTHPAEEIRGCADAILGRYDDAPVRSMVQTIAFREVRECLRANRCAAVTAA